MSTGPSPTTVKCDLDSSFVRVGFELPRESEYRHTSRELPALLRAAADWIEAQPDDGSIVYQLAYEITGAGDESETAQVALYVADLVGESVS